MIFKYVWFKRNLFIIDEIIMVGFFYGKKNEYFGVCIIVSVCFFYFLIKKYFIDFWEKKKYKLML